MVEAQATTNHTTASSEENGAFAATWQDFDLNCQYAGLALRTPIIVAASPLTDSPAKIVRLVEAGAGAVVLRSLFEEDAMQVAVDSLGDQSVDKHTEAYEYIREMGKLVEPDQYMDILAEARRQTDVPIIVSLNGMDLRWWQDYAFGLERAGASAIELNLGMLQLDPNWSAQDERKAEQKFLSTLAESAAELGIPLTLKVSPHMANSLPQLCRMAQSGVRGMVYFNRYFLPDINLKTLAFQPGPRISHPVEFHVPLRYLALHAPLLQHAAEKSGQSCDLVLSTGVHSGEQLLKALLAGAAAVQVCSVLMQNGPAYIGEMLNELTQWLRREQIPSLKRLRAQQCLKDDPHFLQQFQRLQYVKTLR